MEKENIDIDDNEEHNIDDDVVFDDVDEEGKSTENVKKVRSKLKKCEQEKREFLEGWQRAKADSINTRKRDEENRLSSVKAAKENVIQSIIPVLDSFELAFQSNDSDKNLDKNWIAGMKGIQSQLIGTLGEYGVIQMNPIGEDFDPNLHDSVESIATVDESQDGKIAEVRQTGYQIDGKILRAAKVTVAEFKN